MKFDVVIPMVFHDDPAWQEQLRKNVSAREIEAMQPRWRSWDLERTQVQLIKKYMPWVNDIIILLSGESQMKEWMIQEGCRIVFHSSFIPSEHLPTFNVLTIEMYLHRIPNLSRYFLYFNDDMFPIGMWERWDFFAPIGERYLPRLHVGYLNGYSANGIASIWGHIMMNNMRVIKKELGWKDCSMYLSYDHFVSAFDSFLLDEFYEKHAEMVEKSIHITRDPQCLNQYVYNHYAISKGQYMPWTEAEYLYIDNCLPLCDFKRFLKVAICKGDYFTSCRGICFNDSHPYNYSKAYKETIRKYLRSYL